MCLLVVLSGVVPGRPLVVAANRDERRERPTIPMTVLDGGDGGGPAILGGRDEVGGGTWLATNAAGVKLSKQTGAEALDTLRAAELLRAALCFLGQPEAWGETPREILSAAAGQWR